MDFGLPGRRLAIFVDGCFQRDYPECKKAPEDSDGWWPTRIKAKRRGDRETRAELEGRGWRVMRGWEREVSGEVVTAIARQLEKAKGERADGQD